MPLRAARALELADEADVEADRLSQEALRWVNTDDTEAIGLVSAILAAGQMSRAAGLRGYAASRLGPPCR
jgi:hypothetical protein